MSAADALVWVSGATQGIDRLPGIIASAKSGKFDLNPSLRVQRETPSFCLIDSDPTASGRLACKLGMEVAIRKARGTGIAFAGVRGQAELLTRFLQMATRSDMIGVDAPARA